MHGRLVRITSSHQNLRTDTVEGDFENLPVAGSIFEMLAPPLTRGVRCIWTSPIEQTWQVEINGKKVVCFKTDNSVYGLVVDSESANFPVVSEDTMTHMRNPYIRQES